jgi:hypothetical protein
MKSLYRELAAADNPSLCRRTIFRLHKTIAPRRSDTFLLGSGVERACCPASFRAHMKTTPKLALLLTAFASLMATPSKAADVSVSFFYDNLDPYGDWVEVGDYGYCWHPRDVSDDWRPYSDGHWVYTDAGWTWVSDEPYGWAVYHYGRWSRVERVGWVWVPDTEWAPAWVSWRRNDRYVGWAPLPPESRTRIGVSIGGWVDAEFDIGPTFYSFVEVRNLGAPRMRSVILPPRENLTIVNQTTNITNIVYQNNVVINRGPDYDVVSRQVERPIRRMKLERRAEVADLRGARAEQLKARTEGDALVVAAPAIQKAADAKPKKVAQRVEKTAVDRGWKNAGDAKQVETARAKIKEEAKTSPGATAQETTPTTPPTDTTAPAKGDRPATAQEPTAPAPGTDPATKPGKGKARDRKTAEAPGAPAKPGEPAATDPNAPAKVGTPEQPGVAAGGSEPARPGKQRGKKAGQQPTPEAIAEEPQTPPEKKQPGARPSRKAQDDPTNQLDREIRREQGLQGETPDQPERIQRPGRKGQDAPANQLDREIRREQGPQGQRPDQPERTQRPGRKGQQGPANQLDREIRREQGVPAERPDQSDRPQRPQVDRQVRERMPAREAQPQRPERPQAQQPQQNRPPQPKAQERAPGPGKARGEEAEGKKKGERPPE